MKDNITKTKQTLKEEIAQCKKANVSCNGKEAPYDHPLVYLKIDQEIGHINCPYCSKKFILSK